jgi:hypothetical protein
VLSSKPSFGVEFRCLTAKLELKDVVAADSSESLRSVYLLPCMYAHGTEIAINADVFSVANHHYHASAKTEHGTYFAIVDGTSLAATATHNVDTFVVEGYAFQSLHIILPEVAHNLISTGDWHWQTTFVGSETTAQHAVYSAEA